jgi:transcriptional regulator with XRE-family HTH domain
LRIIKAITPSVETEIRDQRSGVRDQSWGWVMRERERRLARRKLDLELRPFRQAGREKNPTNALLRTVRQVLRVPVAEIAEKMGVSRSAIFDMEEREPKNTITLSTLSRVAEAMGCKLVYGIVPRGGKNLEELAEERLWTELLKIGNRD